MQNIAEIRIHELIGTIRLGFTIILKIRVNILYFVYYRRKSPKLSDEERLFPSLYIEIHCIM